MCCVTATAPLLDPCRFPPTPCKTRPLPHFPVRNSSQMSLPAIWGRPSSETIFLFRHRPLGRLVPAFWFCHLAQALFPPILGCLPAISVDRRLTPTSRPLGKEPCHPVCSVLSTVFWTGQPGRVARHVDASHNAATNSAPGIWPVQRLVNSLSSSFFLLV